MSDFIDKIKFYLMIIDNRYYRIKLIFGYRLRALLGTLHNRKNESFIIINGDIQKLYSKWPLALESMILGHFATQY